MKLEKGYIFNKSLNKFIFKEYIYEIKTRNYIERTIKGYKNNNRNQINKFLEK